MSFSPVIAALAFDENGRMTVLAVGRGLADADRRARIVIGERFEIAPLYSFTGSRGVPVELEREFVDQVMDLYLDETVAGCTSSVVDCAGQPDILDPTFDDRRLLVVDLEYVPEPHGSLDTDSTTFLLPGFAGETGASA